MSYLKNNKYIIWLVVIIAVLFTIIGILNRKYRIEPMDYLNAELQKSSAVILSQPNPEGFYKVPEESIKIAGNTPYGYIFRRYIYKAEFFFEPIQVEYKIANNEYFIRPSVVTTSDLELMLFPDDTLYIDKNEFHFFACPWYENAVDKKLVKLKSLKQHKKID